MMRPGSRKMEEEEHEKAELLENRTKIGKKKKKQRSAEQGYCSYKLSDILKYDGGRKTSKSIESQKLVTAIAQNNRLRYHVSDECEYEVRTS